MRPLILISLALVALSALSAEPAQPYPLWDGQETIAEYAKRTGLEPTKTLDLGNGVKLELVLIPAEKFVMGTPEPKPVDEPDYHSKILTGRVILAVGGGALLILLGVVLVRAIRKRQRPQYSLAWFLAMTVAGGIGVMGGMHWHYSARAFAQAQSEYEAALARFKSSTTDEKPAHEVTLTKPYYMGKFEVTQKQYQQVTGTNPSLFRGNADLPVADVSWKEAQEFCKRVQEMTGVILRLPSEAQWEYACRAGTQTTYYSGDDEASLNRVGWYDSNCARYGSEYRVHYPVGKKEANAFGLYDMHGNVSEWCEDHWHDDYNGAPSDGSPWVDDEPRGRVTRGGGGEDPTELCRSACRRWEHSPELPDRHLGFRVVAVHPRL